MAQPNEPALLDDSGFVRMDRPKADASVAVADLASPMHSDAIAKRASTDRGPRRLPRVWIMGAGAAAVALVAVIAIVMFGGGDVDDDAARPAASSASKSDKHDDVASAGVTDSRVAGSGAVSGSRMRIDEATRGGQRAKPADGEAATPTETDEVVASTDPSVGTESVPAMPATSTTPTTPSTTETPKTVPPTPVKPRPTPTLGGKKVVLEYDTGGAATKDKKPTPIPATVKDDSAAIGAARITYFSGNRKLYAGDADAAIKLYRQALAVYPGYVAGYRGLGLAYAQKGDKANALKAFRTYIGAVPAAKDVPLIRKRITTLQRGK